MKVKVWKTLKEATFRKALPGLLVSVMVLGNVTPAFADDTQNNNDQTEGYTYNAPTDPMEVDTNIITATAHRAASPVIDMLGLNASAGFGMINGSAPTNLAEAKTKPALGIWGTSLNDNPDPYYWNYFYNFYAAENNLPTTDDALRNPSVSASPGMADSTLLEEYGNISVSLSTRPEIVVGCAATGESNSDTSGYAEQLDTIHNFAKDSAYYQPGDETYDPKLVAYVFNDLTTMVATMKNLASAIQEVSAATGKTVRYGNPMTIANDYEKYIYGTSAYVLSEIAKGTCKKKTVAIINAINEDGTYTLSDSSSMSATSKVRAVEYVNIVADNLADTLGKTTVTAEEIGQGADVIICMDNVNAGLSASGIKEALGDSYQGQMLITTTPTTLYGLTMNSVENAMGLGYIVGYMYSDVLPIDPVEMCAYFYSKFYHVTDIASLKTIVQTNFAGTDLSYADSSASLADDYSPAKVENLLVAGMRYYQNNKDAFDGTYIAEAGWDIDWNDGIGAGQEQPGTQTISGVEDSYSKTYGDEPFTLAAATDGDGSISYEVTEGSSVSVEPATGVVSILSAGTSVITVRAAETTEYAAAAKTVTVTVEKAAQSISGVSSAYTKKTTDKAFTLNAKASGQVTYTSNKPGVAAVGKNTGMVTVKGAGTAKITVTAAETDNYKPASKTITVKVEKVSQTVTLTKGSASYKVSVLKKKKRTFNIGAKAQGKITYKVKSGNKYISVKQNGAVTVKKNTPKGTYKVSVTAAATAVYKAASKTVNIKVTK